MIASNYMLNGERIVRPLRQLLFSGPVLSKQFIFNKGLVAAAIDDNHLYDDKGHALVNAFKHLGVTTFNWCKTSDILNPPKSPNIHVVDCTYDGLLTRYLEFDESIHYWDRILFLNELNAIVLHTAQNHIIYVGSKMFIDEATQRTNQFRDGWLSVIGQAFSDPELIAEYGLTEQEYGGN